MLITFYEFPSGNRLPIYGFSPTRLVSHGISHTSSNKKSMPSSGVQKRDAIIANRDGRTVAISIGNSMDLCDQSHAINGFMLSMEMYWCDIKMVGRKPSNRMHWNLANAYHYLNHEKYYDSQVHHTNGWSQYAIKCLTKLRQGKIGDLLSGFDKTTKNNALQQMAKSYDEDGELYEKDAVQELNEELLQFEIAQLSAQVGSKSKGKKKKRSTRKKLVSIV
eukprot:447520_1